MHALTTTTTRKFGVRALITLALVVSFLAVAAPGFSMEKSKVTVNKQTGGQPTRFTFESEKTDADGAVDSVALVFPEGFDLSAARIEALTLVGLQRKPVQVTTSTAGQELTVRFTPPVEPNSTLRIQVYEVLTPIKGGEYPMGVRYTVAGQARTVDGLAFEYDTPAREEIISRALDNQTWVREFNSVKILSLFFKPQLIALSVPLLFMGWLLSISFILLAFPLATAGGLALAFSKMSKIAPLRWLAGAYVNVIRGTPLFLQMFVFFIGLRVAGLRVNDYATAVAVLALNSSAYLTEIFRAGIQSIHKGQFEAASSLGMTYRQSMQYVIIPQTVKRVLPTMTSEFILLFKDTALLSALGVIELMYRANSIVSRTGNLTPFVIAAVYYLIVTIPLINWVGRLEHKLAIAEGGQGAAAAPKKRMAMEGMTRTVSPGEDDAPEGPAEKTGGE